MIRRTMHAVDQSKILMQQTAKLLKQNKADRLMRIKRPENPLVDNRERDSIDLSL